jgi:NADH dehydrogenase
MKLSNDKAEKKRPHVVIIGGGFGGLYAARKLGNSPFDVTIIDKRNFHLFQPLLYQVATGEISPGDIASPIRAVLNRYPNIRVLKGEARDIDVHKKCVFLNYETLAYDYLIVATGATHFYFGHDEWADYAPGLKTIEDALQLRSYIFNQFELAELTDDPKLRESLLTFVIVGAGPTGVEMSGAIAELAYSTLKKDFKNFNPEETKVILLEAGPRILPPYDEKLSEKAANGLRKLGVTVRINTRVVDIKPGIVEVETPEGKETISAKTVIWAAGVRASEFGKVVAEKTGAKTDRNGRIFVNEFLQVPGCPEVFVIGDLAVVEQDGKTLPGIAPVAMQEGKYVAQYLKKLSAGKKVKPFRYFDKGQLAVIGRNRAVAQIGPLKLYGWIAWLLWVFVHIAYLIEFENRLLVLIQWGWNYFTRKRGARLITGEVNRIFSANALTK